ncbi:MAG TPA: hypothetical protein VIK56_09180 [Rhodoferax sp.]
MKLKLLGILACATLTLPGHCKNPLQASGFFYARPGAMEVLAQAI